MLIIPAIDLKDGHCVRLKQGLMEESTVFSEDPGAMARHWVDQLCGGPRKHRAEGKIRDPGLLARYRDPPVGG